MPCRQWWRREKPSGGGAAARAGQGVGVWRCSTLAIVQSIESITTTSDATPGRSRATADGAPLLSSLTITPAPGEGWVVAAAMEPKSAERRLDSLSSA